MTFQKSSSQPRDREAKKKQRRVWRLGTWKVRFPIYGTLNAANAPLGESNRLAQNPGEN